MRYRFTHGIPAVLPLTHDDPGVEVFRYEPRAEDAEPEVGAIVLALGDEIEVLDEGLFAGHPYLEALGDPEPETDKQRKAREKAEAEALLAAAASAPASGIVVDGSQSPDSENGEHAGGEPPADADSAPQTPGENAGITNETEKEG